MSQRPAILLLAFSLAACGGAGSGDDTSAGLAAWLGETADSGEFARATAVRDFEFPADHGPHPRYRTEWWYYTGNLSGRDGRHFGFQLTFFRFALPATAGTGGSAWASDQVWMAHLALTDTAAERFQAFERFERGALGMAGATAAPVRVWLHDWSATGQADSLLPVTLSAAAGDVGIELTLDGRRPVVLQGDRGLDAKGPEPGNASYYYSLTRLDARGTVTTGDGEHAVSGSAWLDREWSTSVLGDDVAGWDWFAIQLDDGHDIMLYRLRLRQGGKSPFSGGVVVAPSGDVRLRLTARDFEAEPGRVWRSDATGARYPVEWRLAIPALDASLTLAARLDQQELDLSVRYWEGAMTVTGRVDGAPVTGVAYTELAGPRAQ
ncbi:MAG: lipocalin-like domain-containing protein [Pseudomonadota bacterium]